MDTYQILRNLDHIETALKNLTNELMFIFPAVTTPGGVNRKEEETSAEEIFLRKIKLIDYLSQSVRDYKERQRHAI